MLDYRELTSSEVAKGERPSCYTGGPDLRKKNLETGILEECGVRQTLPSRCDPLKNG